MDRLLVDFFLLGYNGLFQVLFLRLEFSFWSLSLCKSLTVFPGSLDVENLAFRVLVLLNLWRQSFG